MNHGRVYLPEERIGGHQILLQSRAVQNSSTIPEPAGPHGSHIAVGGLRPPSHASHPVVSEATLKPRNPRVVIHDPSKQGSQSSTSVVVGQGTPFPGNGFSSPNTTITVFSSPNTTITRAITITTDASMEGCHSRPYHSTTAFGQSQNANSAATC